MASDQICARGLTLIEVLLALVLLAALAAISVGIFRDASAATDPRSHAENVDETASLADGLIKLHGEALGKLSTGQTWRPPAEENLTDVEVTREPCEGCPDGWARLSITDGTVILSRFYRVDPREQVTE